MKRMASLSRHLRLVLAAALATPVAITLAASPASPTQAALGGQTPFEIDSNTTVQTGTDWVSKFAAGEVAVSNDANFTGNAVVQSDVGSASTSPSWLANCPSSNSDTVFKNSTNIADPDWTGDFATQSVPDKTDICQSYFASDVIESGPNAGHIIAYIAFTRRVFNGDGSFYFLLSKGPNPNIRVAGDIVFQVDYGSQGQAQSHTSQLWSGAGTPTLGAATAIAVNSPNVQLSPVQYFAEMALDLTALGLAPNVYSLPTPSSCEAFGFGRVISRTGNSPSATLKDDGEPAGLDFNLCGSLIIKKQLTAAVPGTTDFPITITPPSDVTLPYPNPVLRVPGGTTSGGTSVDGNANPAPNATPTGNPITYASVPVRQGDGYNVWEPLAGDLGVRWDLVSIVCVNDNGTEATGDDVTTVIDDPSDEFALSPLETVTCTITNSPAPAVINVDKLAGGVSATTWPVTLSGAGSGSVNVSDDGTNNFTTPGTFQTFGNRPAGSYTLTEGAASGGAAFRPSGWSCTVVGGGTTNATGAAIGVNANPGDVINCTVTNTPVAPPNVEVTKTASPTSFPETATAPGSPIVYTVDVKNAGTEPFKITTLTDAVEGGAPFNLATATAGTNAGLPGATFVSNNCGALIDQTVAAGVTVTCQFSVSYTGRNAGDQIDDQVVGSVVDNFGRTDSDDGNATVTVTDVLPVITVDKQNVAVNGAVDLVFPGGLAKYSIEIGNPSTAVEPITITSITDTMSSATDAGFGPQPIDITDVDGLLVTDSTCDDYVGEVLDPGESVTCEFTINTTVIGALVPGDTVTNTIAAVGHDDDGNSASDDDSATRNILSQAPQLTVFKSDGDVSIHEPGEEIAYTVRIVNQSASEGLEIQVISDTIDFLPAGGVAPGDLQSRGTVTISDPGTGVVVDAGGLTGGVTLADTTCDDLIGTVLAQNDLVDDSGPDEATCTITLFLPGNAGDSYHDVVEVTGQGVITLEQVTGDNEAQTPVVNVAPAVEIVKVADPETLPETGGQVEYTLTVTNKSVSSDPLTITDLSDSVFGSFFPNDTTTGIDSTDCFDLEGVVLAAGESVDCTITATISGNAGTSHDNIASVTGEDDEGNPASDTDPASVGFTDVLPKIVVTKSADPTTVLESGGLVTFRVTVENDTLEPVTTTALVDAINGGSDIDLVGLDGSTCVAGVMLAADDGVDGSGPDFYSCTFTRTVAQVGNELSETDVVTVDAKDDENNPASDNDDATVEFELIPPTVVIAKTDDDATVDEPGGDVTYSIDITNTSFEPVTVTELTDTITYEIPASETEYDLLDLDPSDPISDFECQDAAALSIDIATYSLDPGETVTCSFVVALEGTAQIVRDVVNVVVVDNDGEQGDDNDDEATPILDVPPAVQIVKTADPVMINVGDEVTYTFVISNLSDVESITLLTLTDDKFGDIYADCVLGGMATELAPNDGVPGGDDETTCTITRVLSETPGTTHVNVATVTAADDEIIRDEGEPVSDSDDASVLTLTPDTNVLKTVSSATRDNATGIWTIVYDIVVNNNGDGRATIDVDDEFKFGGGVQIVTDSVAVVAPDGVTVNPDFDGVEDTLIAHTTLAAHAEQTYTVTVKATIDEPVPGQGACDPDGLENGGFLNTVRVSSNFGPDATSYDCAPFSTLRLVKALTPNSSIGGTATVNDFTLTASAGQPAVTILSGTSGVTSDVAPGSYALGETQVSGYRQVGAGFDCTNNEVLSSSVTLAGGDDVTCTVTNELIPKIEITALAPECVNDAPFISYDITPFGFVSTGNAKLSFFDLDGNFVESVDVTALKGRVVFPGAEVDAQGNAIDWPGWKFENGLWVTDPSDARLREGLKVVVEVNPTAEGTVSYPPATAPCADPQQVAADMAIVKTASVPQVGAGGAFTWLLDVTNNGPDAATNVVVNDIVPGQVTVTGVSSSEFTCTNTGNTVNCTKSGMAVGETGHIAIAVSVPTTAADGDVTNIGSVTANQPDPNSSNNSDDASVTIVAQAPPPPTPPPVILPPTGSNSTTPVTWAAISLMFIGGVVLLVSRRRRDHTSFD